MKVINALKEEKGGKEIMKMQDVHYCTQLPQMKNYWTVSILALQKRAQSLILLNNPCFEASRGWVRQFKERHNLALRKKTSLWEKLPSQLQSKISLFYSECTRFLKIGNIYETPVFFDMVPERSLTQKGQKSVTIRTSGSEKRHVTVVLTVAADGFILPPMIIFWGKTSQTIKDIEAPECFVIVTQEKAWMDESLMFIWFDQVWKSYAEKNKRNWISTDR